MLWRIMTHSYSREVAKSVEGALEMFSAGVVAGMRCSAAILAYNGKTPVQLGPKLWVLPLGLVLS